MTRVQDLFRRSAKARLSVFSGSGVLLLAGILILVNLLSQTFFVRWDWTAGNRYTLTRASRALVRSLEDPLVIRVFMSGGLPEPLASQSRYVRDLLQEYRVASRGKVQVEFLDPDESDKVRNQANGAGVLPSRVQLVARDQFQVREAYLGLALFHQDKQEVIPFVKNTETLEYEISSRVKRMIAGRKPVLGVVTGHGEESAAQLQGGLMAPLFEHFDVKDIALSTGAARPDILLVAGPMRQISPDELRVLDGFAAQGVPAVVFASRRTMNLRSFTSMAHVTGLEPWLEHYGLRMERDFVLDAQCETVQLQAEPGVFSILKYPAFVLSTALNRTHPATRGLGVMSFAFAHPIVVSTASGPSLRVTPLAHSSRYSWTVNQSSLDPYNLQPPSDSNPKGPFALAAAVEGSTRAYSDPQKSADAVKIVLVGTPYFLSSEVPNRPENSTFLITLFEWLAQDPHLLSIPSKGAAFRPLRQISDVSRQVIKISGIFLLPLMIVLAGFLHWQNRQRQRLKAERLYREAASHG